MTGPAPGPAAESPWPATGPHGRAAGRDPFTDQTGDLTMTTDRMPRGPGLFRIRTGDGPPLVTSIRRLAGTDREPGSVLVTAGMALLALLDAGLLYVVFAAQDRFIFSVKHQNVASMIQALALDVAMIIFSVLALGLARKGLPANVERALIVVCALASAFMNWTASDHTSLRSVAVYVSAPHPAGPGHRPRLSPWSAATSWACPTTPASGPGSASASAAPRCGRPACWSTSGPPAPVSARPSWPRRRCPSWRSARPSVRTWT